MSRSNSGPASDTRRAVALAPPIRHKSHPRSRASKDLTDGPARRYTPQRCLRRAAAKRPGMTRKLGQKVDNEAVKRYASLVPGTGHWFRPSGQITHNGGIRSTGRRAGKQNCQRKQGSCAAREGGVVVSPDGSFDKVQRGRCGGGPAGCAVHGSCDGDGARPTGGACRIASRIIATRRPFRGSHLSASLILAQEQRWRRA